MNSKQISLFEKDTATNILSKEDLDKENFTSFSWALPLAFSEPLCFCRFEEGDVIYDTHNAYIGTWAESLKHISYSIQINFPPRAVQKKLDKNFDSVQKKSDKDSDSVFANNWRQTVTFSLTNYKTEEIKEIKTIQGKLYSFLWKGGFSFFENNKEVSIPIQALKSIEFLKESELYFKTIAVSKLQNPDIFIMPYDRSNSLLKNKFNKVNSCLSNDFDEKYIIFDRANKFINQTKQEFIPTLQFVCFAVSSDIPLKIEESLKKALYTPSENKKTKKDRFLLKRHGLFIPFK